MRIIVPLWLWIPCVADGTRMGCDKVTVSWHARAARFYLLTRSDASNTAHGMRHFLHWLSNLQTVRSTEAKTDRELRLCPTHALNLKQRLSHIQ